VGKLTASLARRAGKKLRQAYEKVENRILVAQGRKALRAKKREAVRVSRKAAKAGVVAGVAAAAGVLLREFRNRGRS
jgi:hypothetical protein